MSVNSNAAKLLGMLNSATSPSPPNPSNSSSIPPPSSTEPSSRLSSSAESPRDPSSFPPPPSLQSLSLQDLFAGIASPSAPIAQTTSAPSPPVQSDHTASLMGLLNGIGEASSPSGGSYTNGAGGRVSLPKEGLSSPPTTSTPPAIGVVGEKTAAPGVHHRANLLNLFKPQSNEVGTPFPSQPVIQHPTGIPSRPLTPGTASATPILPHIANNAVIADAAIAEPATTQHPVPQDTARHDATPSTTAPSKSMFDFVSPFDAFDKPKTKSTPTKTVTPAPPAPAGSSPKPASAPSPAPSSAQSDAKPAAQQRAQAQRTQNIQPSATGEIRQRHPSGPASNASSSQSREIGSPWTLNKVIPKGTEGKGPKAAGKNITVDLSKPNVESLVNAPGVTQIIPTTILKQDNVRFAKGRSVALTSNFMAYAMTKGRARLIDMLSGSRCMLSPSRSEQNGILDIAATADSVAVLYSDHSVMVWRVPSTWVGDDPETRNVLRVKSSQADAESVGALNRVEWVKKDGQNQLILGGDQGVVFVKIPEEASDEEIDLSEFERQKVLKTEGAVAAFSLNSSHQAIGLLSTKGQFTLYNVATLNRVWNRPLPSSFNKASVPSSVHFIESNILVGRESNTQFDLVQITTDIAVLATIKFQAPPPATTSLHFSQVVYDASRNTLFVAPFSRGTLFAFRYALKGVAPIKVSEKPDVVPFDKMAEYPLEPVLSLVLSPKSAHEDAELFFATPGGFSLVHLDQSACETLTVKAPSTSDTAGSTKSVPPPRQAPTPQSTVTDGSAALAAIVSAQKEQAEPVKKNARLPSSARHPSEDASPPGPKLELPSGVEPDAKPVGNAYQEEDINKLLKRSEDKIANNVKQILNHQLGLVNHRLDALANGSLVDSINQHVASSIKATLTTTIQAEIKKAMGGVTANLHREVQTTVQSTTPPMVAAALQDATAHLEKSLLASLQRSIPGSVHQSIERALNDTLQHRLAPLLHAETSAVTAKLAADIRSELLQIRKDLTPRGDANANTDALIRALAESVTDLQKQVAGLSEQFARNPNGHAQSHQGGPLPMTAPPSVPVAPHPQGISMPPAQMLEDAFLSVLSSPVPGALVALVDDHWVWTESILPNPPATSPLSPAVILTLLHRLALVLSEMNPTDQNFARLLIWERRVSILLDPSAPEIASFYTRVVPIAQATLGSLRERVMRNVNGPAEAEAVRGLEAVLKGLASKA